MTLRLVADIGGTTSRFALARNGTICTPVLLRTAEYANFHAALWVALTRLGVEKVDEAAIAAAGPRIGEAIDLTNVPWRIDAAIVSDALGGAPVRVANDLEAVALALPHLGPGDTAPIRGSETSGGLPIIAINVGTGFGAAVTVPTAGSWAAVAGEPGHMRLGGMDDEERGALIAVRSVEDVLSGSGLVALAKRLGASAETASEVFAGEDIASCRAVAIFAGLLGRVAGDLVLATGAWGGACLCGGVVAERRGEPFEARFLDAFDDKGKMTPLMRTVPVCLLKRENPALLGLSAL